MAQAAYGCILPITDEVRVAHALSGDSFQLDDGRIVKLAAVLAPGTAFSDEPAGVSEEGRAHLERLTAGRRLALHVVAEADRHGRIVAHPSEPGSGGVSVEAALLAAGAGRLLPGGDGCQQELRAAETAARAARLGVWRHPYYSIRAAHGGEAAAAAEGDYLVAEGRVATVRTAGARVYLNFGQRGNGLSVTVWKGHFDKFPEGESGLKRLEGLRVRVRGWVWSRSQGAVVAVASPDQIERLDSSGADAQR